MPKLAPAASERVAADMAATVRREQGAPLLARRLRPLLHAFAGEAGQIDGAVVAIQDVSELREAQARLELADQIDEPPQFGTHIAREYLQGMIRLREQILPLLDTSQVLSIEQLESLGA